MKTAPLRDSTGAYPVSAGRSLRCLRCNRTIPSLPAESLGCECGNVYVDVGYRRVSIEDEGRVVALVDGPVPTVYSPGDCPVGCGELVFATAEPSGQVLTYCSSCGCAWRRPEQVATQERTTVPEDFGARLVRAADLAEVEAAGLAAFVAARYERPGWSGPDECPWPLRACDAYAIDAAAAWRHLKSVAERTGANVRADEAMKRVSVALGPALSTTRLTAWIVSEGDCRSVLHVDLARPTTLSSAETRRLHEFVERIPSGMRAAVPAIAKPTE